MKEEIKNDIEKILNGNTRIAGIEIADKDLKVYLESEILSSFGESNSPNIMIKINKEGKVISDFSAFDFEQIAHLPFRTQLRGVSSLFEDVDKTFQLLDNNKNKYLNRMNSGLSQTENKSSVRRNRP